ncbi:MAG TPA: VTT domain-containing protein [Ohtaekwangia sp.]
MVANGKKTLTAKARSKKVRTHSLFIGCAILLLALVACYFIFPGFQAGVNEAFDVITSNDKERIRTWVKQFGVLGPVVLILAMGVQMFMLIIPNILLFAIAIICYGPVWGGLISLAGVFLSSSLGYAIGKKLGPRAIDRFVSQKTQDKIQVFIERYGVKAVMIFRLSSISTDSLGFVAGILEMNYKKYILATLAGVTPVIVLIAIYGNGGRIETALIWIASISLAILFLYMFLDRHKRHAAIARKTSKK